MKIIDEKEGGEMKQNQMIGAWVQDFTEKLQEENLNCNFMNGNEGFYKEKENEVNEKHEWASKEVVKEKVVISLLAANSFKRDQLNFQGQDGNLPILVVMENHHSNEIKLINYLEDSVLNSIQCMKDDKVGKLQLNLEANVVLCLGNIDPVKEAKERHENLPNEECVEASEERIKEEAFVSLLSTINSKVVQNMKFEGSPKCVEAEWLGNEQLCAIKAACVFIMRMLECLSHLMLQAGVVIDPKYVVSSSCQELLEENAINWKSKAKKGLNQLKIIVIRAYFSAMSTDSKNVEVKVDVLSKREGHNGQLEGGILRKKLGGHFRFQNLDGSTLILAGGNEMKQSQAIDVWVQVSIKKLPANLNCACYNLLHQGMLKHKVKKGMLFWLVFKDYILLPIKQREIGEMSKGELMCMLELLCMLKFVNHETPVKLLVRKMLKCNKEAVGVIHIKLVHKIEKKSPWKQYDETTRKSFQIILEDKDSSREGECHVWNIWIWDSSLMQQGFTLM